MNDKQLYENLSYLIIKYIDNSSKKHILLEQISNRGFYGVKGVLHEINNSSKVVDPKDSELIKDIAYHFV